MTQIIKIFLVISIIIFSCTDRNNKEKEDVFFKETSAKWIQDSRKLPESDSLFYLDEPAPLFRKEFQIGKTIKKASLFITAAGYYAATINQKRIGKNVLDPAWTDYTKKIYYSEYDITSQIKNGKNCLGVTIGNGFYNPLPLKMWGRINLREEINIGKPSFISKLIITYEDGDSEEIVSDESWKYAYGPIIRNSVYIGTYYDARKEIKGWNASGFNDSSWEYVQISNPPGGKLQNTFFPPVQITKEITPKNIYSSKPGVWLVDMGENFTGTYKIKISGDTGDTITFRFGERIYEDGTLNTMTAVTGQIKNKGVGGPGAPDIAWQTDSYIIGDKTSVWYIPEFTYHAYRYMDIVGLKEKPEIEEIIGLSIHSNVKNENNFSSSSELLNDIQNAAERTFLANLVSVQSDCPAREKFGYGGDLNATSESFIYNFDMQSFYRKTIYDWVDAMNDSIFIDTAPFVGIQYCGLSWESAFLITQYYLYLYYNDTEIIKELYTLNNKWMEKASRIHPDGIVDKGLSDHESLEPVPVELTGTLHYLQSAQIMKLFSSIMNNKLNEEKYDKLSQKLEKIVKTKFWDTPVKEKINRQTLFSSLLYHNIIPKDQIEAAKDSLLKAVKNGPSGHFNTGIFGTKYVLEALSKNLSADVVYNIVNSREFPGWGHMIDQGATTIWETWKESDNYFSNSHPMFGVVTEWYYRWLGGIRPDPNYPGFKEFTLNPFTPKGLNHVNTTYNSPFGKIVSNWEKESTNSYRYEMVIPEGSIANVSLQVSSSQEIKIINKLSDRNIKNLKSGNFKLDKGDYIIRVSEIK
jgi:alpha-L-rhamnosidase